MDSVAIAPLVRALETDSSAEVRREAALALGRCTPMTRDVLDALQAAAATSSVEVRRAALVGLARNGDREAAQRLLALMEDSPELAYDVAAAIAAAGDKSLIPAIAGTLSSAASARARSGAARALGDLAARTGPPDDPPFVWEDREQRRHVLV